MTSLLDDADQTPQVGVEIIKRGRTALIRFHGEADIACLDGLETVLNGIDLGNAESVHLDVADLSFCDGAAMRQLTLFAEQAHRGGRIVSTTGATHTLREMTRLAGVQDDLGLI